MDIYTPDHGLMIFQTLSLVHLLLICYAIYRLFKNDDNDSGSQRMFSFLLLMFIPIVGSLIYLRNSHRPRRRMNLDRKD